MKLFNRVKMGVMLITAVLLLSAVMPFITPAQSQQGSMSQVINKPTYTNVAAQLGLPYNVTLSNMTKPGYVDPIVSQANKWKSEGMNDAQIVNNFEKKGVIYNPKTGDWAFGHNLTPEEQKRVPNIPPFLTSNQPLNSTSQAANSNVMPLTYPSKVVAGMWTANYAYMGFDCYMRTGDLPLDTNGQYTQLYYTTTHIGTTDQGWCEIGVYHYYLDPSNYQVYTYTQDDTGGGKPVGITVNPSDFHEYTILCVGQDSSGYKYALAIDGQVVRTNHIGSLNCEVSQCLEVFCGSAGQYTNFNGCTYNMFRSQRLYLPGVQTISWGPNVPDWPCTPMQDPPTHLYRSAPTGSWTNEMWVQT